MTSPLLGCGMRAHEDSGHACKIGFNVGRKPIPYTESLHKPGILVTLGRGSLGRGRVSTWSVWAQLWSFFCL